MFSEAMIAFLLAAGFSAWVYSKIFRSSGGNTQNALIVAGVSGGLLFFLALSILSFIF